MVGWQAGCASHLLELTSGRCWKNFRLDKNVADDSCGGGCDGVIVPSEPDQRNGREDEEENERNSVHVRNIRKVTSRMETMTIHVAHRSVWSCDTSSVDNTRGRWSPPRPRQPPPPPLAS
ncbi:hypothetical protein C0Q70_16688 [Pomacea canaliculata]|uniref:Uncharacterized protein n=1 Tax=Pomacea canaliculata TaxID=400727 RepID=A0A2T7NQG9_POMCA|nr:hypothetical protein C0Q70_16688 [Pomacea canaliculata]